jgi:hypothetical protein
VSGFVGPGTSLARPLETVLVMPGLGPGIHDLASGREEVVDGRAKPGHDGGRF